MSVFGACWSGAYLVVILLWTYGFGSFGRTLRAPQWVATFAHEVHPFFLYILVIDLGLQVWQSESFGESFTSYFIKAIQFTAWYFADRDDDDDRWKRRRRKVGDKVRSIGHRLAVVPQGSA